MLALLLGASLASARPVDDVNALVDAQVASWTKKGIDAPVDDQALYTNGAHFAITGGFGGEGLHRTQLSRRRPGTPRGADT